MNVSLDLFQVRDLIEKIREAFVETLDELQWMDEASKEKAREKVRDNKELQYSLMNMIYLAFCSITISSFSTNKRKRLRCSLLSCYIVLSFQSFVSPHQYKCQLATMQFPKKTPFPTLNWTQDHQHHSNNKKNPQTFNYSLNQNFSKNNPTTPQQKSQWRGNIQLFSSRQWQSKNKLATQIIFWKIRMRNWTWNMPMWVFCAYLTEYLKINTCICFLATGIFVPVQLPFPRTLKWTY